MSVGVFVNGKPVAVTEQQVRDGSWKKVVEGLAKSNPEQAKDLYDGCKEIANSIGQKIEAVQIGKVVNEKGNTEEERQHCEEVHRLRQGGKQEDH